MMDIESDKTMVDRFQKQVSSIFDIPTYKITLKFLFSNNTGRDRGSTSKICHSAAVPCDFGDASTKGS